MRPASLLIAAAAVAAGLAGVVVWATHDSARIASVKARPVQPVGTTSQACGKSVIKDWYDDGRVGKLYPLACYQVALRTIPMDIDFSTAPEDIRRALDFARTGKLVPRRLPTRSVSASSPTTFSKNGIRTSVPPGWWATDRSNRG